MALPLPNTQCTTGANPATQHTSDDQQLINANIVEANFDRYQPLYHAAFRGNWEEGKKFLANDPDAVTARISNLSMTALHVAACEGHSEFVEKLVQLMPAGELEALDDMGFTALHYAAIGGSLRSAKALVAANRKLTQSLDIKGRTPLLLAASFASESKELVWYLLLVTKDEEPGRAYTGPWAANLFNFLVASGFHVIPVEMDNRPPHSMRAYVGGHESVQNPPRMPASAQNRVVNWLRRLLCGAIKQIGLDCNLTLPYLQLLEGFRSHLLHFELSAPTHFMRLQDAKRRHHCAVELVKQICTQLSRKDFSWRMNYILNFEILSRATISGTTEIIRTLLEFFPDLIWVRQSSEQFFLLRYAIQLRHENIFLIFGDQKARNKLMAFQEHESGGTILHLAAKLAPLPKLSSISGAALQMQRELQWFKAVEKLVHPYFKEFQNNNDETARELFTKEHKQLAESGEKWLKDTSNSCMLVSTLIATVVFAAAFTVPGGNNNDGAPNFLPKHPLIFMVFVVSDALSLFASLTSLLMFLSILTARYAEEDFLESLPKKLILGLASLFFAIATMMVAFGATLFIVLNKKFNWIYIPITLLATFPVTLFASLQLPLFIQMIQSTLGKSIFRPQNIW